MFDRRFIAHHNEEGRRTIRELPSSLPMRSLVLPFLASLTTSRSVCLVSAEERGEEPGEVEPMRGAGPAC